jgi:hypothetical protein
LGERRNAMKIKSSVKAGLITVRKAGGQQETY